MGNSLGFVVEALVALLLMVTIGYCILVNRKLEQLRSDQSELRQIIRELNIATGQAETAIATLRESAQSADGNLTEKIDTADALAARLSGEVARGEALLSKLSLLSRMPRVAEAPPAPQPAPRSGLRASAVGIGLLNAQRRSANDQAQGRGAA